MAGDIQETASYGLAEPLCKSLVNIAQNPYPHVPNPENCKKRASVALVLRIRPDYKHQPSSDDLAIDPSADASSQIERFFSQDWVKQGDPEVVFIKRAAREGDRWTSHVALPGGKQDPEDADDKATAIRETVEEIGLDLTSKDALLVGNLPERVVSTSWGKVPIMVLCPFIFLWIKPDVPPLKLQPTEVASTHWVPLRVLLSPAVRTYEHVDVSDRFAKQGGILLRTVLRKILGKLRFSAIQLVPSESLYSSSIKEFFPVENTDRGNSVASNLYQWCIGSWTESANKTRPLLLWGLTLGVLADFLDQLPPNNAVALWSHPTFTSWDTRMLISIMTWNLKRRNQARWEASNIANQTAIDSQTEAVAAGDNPCFEGGLNDESLAKGRKNASKSYAVGLLLEGYYDMVKKGVWLSVILRMAGIIALTWQIIRRYKSKRGIDH